MCLIDARYSEIDHSLQVRVNGSSFTALGWINNELQLETAHSDRQKMAAVNRILNNSYGADDVYELLSLLITHTCTASKNSAKMAGSLNDKSEPKKLVPFSLESWLMSSESFTRASNFLSTSSSRGFDALYLWVNGGAKKFDQSELNHQAKKINVQSYRKLDGKILSDARSQNRGTVEYQAKEERNRRLLQNLLESIPLELMKNPAHPSAADLIQIDGAIAVRNALRNGAANVIGGYAAQPCLKWLDQYSRIGLNPTVVSLLEPIIVAMGCLAFFLDQGAELAGQTASQIKECYQRYGIDTYNETQISDLFQIGISKKCFSLVDKELWPQLEGFIPKVLNVQTGSDLASGIVRKMDAEIFPGLTESEKKFLGPEIFAAVLVGLRSSKRRYGLVHNLENAGCPCCYLSLNSDVIRRLRQTHVAICSNSMMCGRPLFWLPEGSYV